MGHVRQGKIIGRKCVQPVDRERVGGQRGDLGASPVKTVAGVQCVDPVGAAGVEGIVCTFDEGLETVRLIDASERAAATREWIDR